MPSPSIVTVYSPPGFGKTTSIVECMDGGEVYTPVKANCDSVESFLQVKLADQGIRVTQVGDLKTAIAKGQKLAEKWKDGASAQKHVLFDDVSVMARKTFEAIRPNYTAVRDNGDIVEDTRGLFGEMSGIVGQFCGVLTNLASRGGYVWVSGHYKKPKTDKDGKPILGQDRAGFALPSAPSVEMLARVSRTMLQLRPNEKFHGGVEAYCNKRDPYAWMKDADNVFKAQGPASLREHFRYAGRDLPGIQPWQDVFIDTVAGRLLDDENFLAGKMPAVTSDLLRDLSKKDSRLEKAAVRASIFRQGYARAWIWLNDPDNE